MRSEKILIVLTLIFTCASAWTKEITDTLESSYGDRVIVTYDIAQNNGQFTIKFLDVRKTIGREFRNKYKKLDEIVVLFFDRKGNYEDNTEFSGINVDAFMIPQEVKYNLSKDGYFSIKDNPTLNVELKSENNTELSIPLFIAHYEGKRRYKVLSRCEDLKIKLSKKAFAKTTDESITQTVSQTVTTLEEVEGTLSESDEANIYIDIIYDLLDEQDGEDFSNELQQTISRLRVIERSTSDKNLSSRINAVLDDCKVRERELKNKAIAAKDSAAKKAVRLAKLAEEQVQARQDSIAAAAQKKAEDERKQNRWLIIGGLILAVIAFVGNQTFQHFRNVKNQKSIMDMQQNAIKRAEDEAKQRARDMAKSHISRAQGTAKSKTRSVINDRIENIGKGKKGFSI